MIPARVTIMMGWIANANVLTSSWTVNGMMRENRPIAKAYETIRPRIRRSSLKSSPTRASVCRNSWSVGGCSGVSWVAIDWCQAEVQRSFPARNESLHYQTAQPGSQQSRLVYGFGRYETGTAPGLLPQLPVAH